MRPRGSVLLFLACVGPFLRATAGGQKEVVDGYQIGNDRHPEELPVSLAAFLSGRPRWYGGSEPEVRWTRSLARRLTERRRKRKAEEDAAATSDSEPFTDQDDYDSFFRNEYYRILAQSFASTRKKRQSPRFGRMMDGPRNLYGPQRPDRTETGFVQPQNAGFRPLPGFSAHPVSNSGLPFGKWKFLIEEKYEQECPPLHLKAKECSALGGIMPEGNLKNILLRACNWLEICYSCGKHYGLQPDTCDTGFLYGIRSVCEGDVPCQATGRLLLLSLRQTGSSQNIASLLCNADQCIEQFLLQPSL